MNKLMLFLVFIAVGAASFSFTDPPSGKATSKGSKSLVFPVAGNRIAIRDKWGASRAGGIRRHKGIDIHARRGTPVVAVCDGIISNRAQTPIGGKTLWLKSASHSWTAYYAHLDQQLVREGQRVRKGQVIGTVGNTGNARTTPSHLHFGVSQSNHWVNPLPIVNGAARVAAPKAAPQKKKTTTVKKTPAKKKASTITKAPAKKKAPTVTKPPQRKKAATVKKATQPQKAASVKKSPVQKKARR